MFETVLVADRGPAARRVVRTCEHLGARTVVVHTPHDRDAPAVRAADEAVPIGGSGWADSYGDPQKVLEAAQRTGAEAVHPGAGPLAEDARLARVVLDAGLAWLGLPPEALERTDQQTAALARSLGLAPATAGRRLVVTTLDGTVLGVREQVRRDDGAPLYDRQPPDLPGDVLAQAEHAALVMARAAGAGRLTAVGLTVAGDAAGVAAVLPVLLLGSAATEEAAGIDLVEVQLRLACDETLPVPGRRRHALALHLRAADRFAGRVRRWAVPAVSERDDVRVDAGVGKGVRLSLASDRTLAVITVTADDEAALRGAARGVVDEIVVEGVPTSLPALREALAHP